MFCGVSTDDVYLMTATPKHCRTDCHWVILHSKKQQIFFLYFYIIYILYYSEILAMRILFFVIQNYTTALLMIFIKRNCPLQLNPTYLTLCKLSWSRITSISLYSLSTVLFLLLLFHRTGTVSQEVLDWRTSFPLWPHFDSLCWRSKSIGLCLVLISLPKPLKVW